MKLSVDYKNPLPLYSQVEEQLRAMIKLPEYKNGAMKLPGEVYMSEQLGISRNTLRQAINNLVKEGLLVRKRGMGTLVLSSSVNSKGKNWQSFTQEMKSMGMTPANYELHLSWEKASEEVCKFFNCTNDQKFLSLKRLRGNSELPFVYFVSYFNPAIPMTGSEDFSRPLYEVLEKDYNRVAKISKEEITARVADKFLAEKLEIKIGAPILVRKRFVFDADMNPIEWNIGSYRADSFTYSLEFCS